MVAMTTGAAAGIPQWAGWALNAPENFYYSLNLSDVLRHALQPQCFYRQFCDVRDPQGEGKFLHKGDIYHWNVYGNLVAPTNNKRRILNENDPMPKGNYPIAQGSLRVTERGQSVDYTGKLDDLSFHPIKEIINKVLLNDGKKAYDWSAYAEFDNTPLVVAPTGGNSATSITLSTTGATAITNNYAMKRGHIKAIRDLMYSRNIPHHNKLGNNYGCITGTTVLRPIKDELEDIRKYTTEGYQALVFGEVGRDQEIRFFEQTNIPDEAWTNAKSAQAHFFGDDTVAFAVCIPEEIRAKIPDDYGRGRGIAWYGLDGFGIVHARDDSDSSQSARIIKWGSAEGALEY